MRPTILALFPRIRRLLRHAGLRIGALLLSATLAACGGGGVSLGFGYVDYDDGYDDYPYHPGWPGGGTSSDPGIFLIAGGLCPTCGGTLDGSGSAARFDAPEGIVLGPDGNLFVAERTSGTIRKVSQQGVAVTLAGSAGASGSSDGAGGAARFNGPTRLEADVDGNLYVTDSGNSTIRQVSAAGAVTTLAGAAGQCGSQDGSAGNARFCNPQGITLDRNGNLYVADTMNHTIRRIDRNNAVTTVAGTAGACGSADGRGNAARFCEPRDIEVDDDGYLYVADTANSTIREISPSGEVRTVAGAAGQCGTADGPGASARFCNAAALTMDGAGTLFVADTGNGTIRRIGSSGAVNTVAGTPGTRNVVLGPLPGSLNAPRGITVLAAGSLAATSQNMVLKLVPAR
ncbi:NHL domain-containing protein [Massilia brevitalea]|uniref:NHL domain-containing protein n=1 Tax=Massilia brevitalea TaxID=442526 RepID=UPI002738A7A1|nr:SMP-30/gluconolactonase/LRE family protein [Massilia brevitalea]